LTSDLAGKASTTAPTFTGFTTLQANPGIGTDTPVTVLGGTGQSVPLQSWRTVGLSQLSSVDQNGYGNFARLTAGQGTDLAYTAALSVNTTGTAVKGVVVRAVASQSANLQEWQNSAGSILSRIKFDGTPVFSYGTFFGQQTLSADADAVKPLVVKGFSATQSANLQEWQNSGGTVIARVDSSGNVRGLSVRTSNDLTSLLEANSGGYLRLTRQTASVSNPGANLGSIYFRDGTTGGTLKLVVRAGAAGAETTILDNIPQ
jgi:hypothetical protein